jgi:hypothetical protein
MTELKSCPFCGKPGECWLQEGDWTSWWCYGCRYCLVYFWDADDWNTRVKEPQEANNE